MRKLRINLAQLEGSNFFGQTEEEIDVNKPRWIAAIEALASEDSQPIVLHYGAEGAVATVITDDLEDGEDNIDTPEFTWFETASTEAWEMANKTPLLNAISAVNGPKDQLLRIANDTELVAAHPEEADRLQTAIAEIEAWQNGPRYKFFDHTDLLGVPKYIDGEIEKIPVDDASIMIHLNALGLPTESELIAEERRIRELENEGMTRSDAQGVYEAEKMKRATFIKQIRTDRVRCGDARIEGRSPSHDGEFLSVIKMPDASWFAVGNGGIACGSEGDWFEGDNRTPGFDDLEKVAEGATETWAYAEVPDAFGTEARDVVKIWLDQHCKS